MDNARPITVDPELARRLKDAATTGDTVAVTIDDQTYRLSITPEPATNLWEGYDPEAVRAAVRRSAALGSSADPADLDAMIAEIRAQRDQASPDSTS